MQSSPTAWMQMVLPGVRCAGSARPVRMVRAYPSAEADAPREPGVLLRGARTLSQGCSGYPGKRGLCPWGFSGCAGNQRLCPEDRKRRPGNHRAHLGVVCQIPGIVSLAPDVESSAHGTMPPAPGTADRLKRRRFHGCGGRYGRYRGIGAALGRMCHVTADGRGRHKKAAASRCGCSGVLWGASAPSGGRRPRGPWGRPRPRRTSRARRRRAGSRAPRRRSRPRR